MSEFNNIRRHERGSAGVKLVIVGVILFLVGHAAYNYIPTAYDGQSLKQEIDTAIMQGSAVSGSPTALDNTKAKIIRIVQNSNVPPNPYVEVKAITNGMQARVYYVKDVHILPFGIYTYKYIFDYTATPTGFLFKQ